MSKIVEKIKEICNDNGFKFEINKDKNGHLCYIGTHTNEGQEWFVEFYAKNTREFLKEIDTYLSNYDADRQDGWDRLNKLYKELKNF